MLSLYQELYIHSFLHTTNILGVSAFARHASGRWKALVEETTKALSSWRLHSYERRDTG